MNNPQISIIVVSYNAGKTIERTINSIINQTYSDYEVVFIDGKSKDETCEIIASAIKRFKKKGIQTKFVSEPDAGAYDAMNKGAKQAQGLWCTYMNADDKYYSSTALERVAPNLTDEVDIVYGDTMFIDGERCWVEKAKRVDTIKTHLPFCPQATFIRTDLQKEYLFDTKYKISADYDFFLRAFLAKKVFTQINEVIANFYFGGISNRNLVNTYKEDTSVKIKNGIEKKGSIVRKIKFIVFRVKMLVRKK